MENLQIISLNARGLQNKNKTNMIFQNFEPKKYDVILLQETDSTQQEENVWKKEWEGPAFFSSLNNLKCGVAILCNNNSNKFKTTYQYSDKVGRLIAIKIETETCTLKVTNIYTPNIPKTRKRLFEKLETCIRNDTKHILGGDFNMVENIPQDRAGGNPTIQQYGIEHLQNIKTNKNMIFDRKQHPAKKEYTYINNLADFKSRIDRFYITSDLETIFKTRTKIVQNYLSDHGMVQLSFYKKLKKT